jgi:hypothetical protein
MQRRGKDAWNGGAAEHGAVAPEHQRDRRGRNLRRRPGSPCFHNTGSGEVLVAVTSERRQARAANAFTCRPDTPLREFLEQFVRLP